MEAGHLRTSLFVMHGGVLPFLFVAVCTDQVSPVPTVLYAFVCLLCQSAMIIYNRRCFVSQCIIKTTHAKTSKNSCNSG